MALPKDEVVDGLTGEMRQLHGLIATLSDDGWCRPTRCEGWNISDVAAHVTGFMADLIAQRTEGLGTQAWYDRQVAERRGRARAAIAQELDGLIVPAREMMSGLPQTAWDGPAPAGIDGSLGRAIQSVWSGYYIHEQDMLAALNRPPRRDPGLRATVWLVAEVWESRRWGPATLAFEGLEEISVQGGGRRVEGDPLGFVLAASGRADARPYGLEPGVNVFG